MLKNFRTYQLCKHFYHRAKSLQLPSPLKNQFERALLSVLLNLSEGSAKPNRSDRRRFYYIAFGSLREVQSCLDIIDHKELIQEADILAAHLYRLCQRT